MLAPGGILVKDDLTLGHSVDGDPVRSALFEDERLSSVEITVAPTMAMIIAVLTA